MRRRRRAIADWKKTGSAVLFPSGYQANAGAIQTAAAVAKLTGGARFLVDKLAHASLLDAVGAASEPFRVFPHNGMTKLRRLLEEAPKDQLQIVVTESIFSMDGDAADFAALATLKRERNFLLIVDEAHASGVYGSGGAGLPDELGVADIVDVSIVTLSKALGGIGGVVCASSVFCQMMVNRGRAYLYSTSIPAAIAAATEAALKVMRDEPWRQQRVRELARRVRQALAIHLSESESKATASSGAQSNKVLAALEQESPIVPIILGDERAATLAAAKLMEQQIFVVPIRPPTVPRGASRLRVTLCCDHTDAEVDQLIRAIASVR